MIGISHVTTPRLTITVIIDVVNSVRSGNQEETRAPEHSGTEQTFSPSARPRTFRGCRDVPKKDKVRSINAKRFGAR